MSPTARSLKNLRERGYAVAVVERWNPYAKIRQDLFGWIDLVAAHPSEPGVLGVQTTTTAHAAERIAKARDNAALAAWIRAGGRLAVFAWAKHKRKLASGEWAKRPVWDLREIQVNLSEVEGAVETRMEKQA